MHTEKEPHKCKGEITLVYLPHQRRGILSKQMDLGMMSEIENTTCVREGLGEKGFLRIKMPLKPDRFYSLNIYPGWPTISVCP